MKQTAVIDNSNYVININGDLLNLKTNKTNLEFYEKK